MGGRRLARERETLEAMIRLRCRDLHRPGAGGLCADCRDLLRYARERLEKCPFGEDKPTCARCPVHCYRPEMRQKVREVMRHAGPRMPRAHPWLALLHLLDGRRKIPVPPRKSNRDPEDG
jgi:hypothetical protein